MKMSDDNGYGPNLSANTRDAEELASRFHAVRNDMLNAADSLEFAYFGSCALSGLHSAALPSRPLRLSCVERDHLLGALARAAPYFTGSFGPSAIGLAATGCKAAARMIEYWWATDDMRSQIGADRRADMVDQVRWLRNELHNRSILSQLELRAANRRAETVNTLRRNATAAASFVPVGHRETDECNRLSLR